MKFFLLAFLITTTSFAQTVKRITANINLQTEITNATNGDIFIVEGGFYGSINITKQVALIGTGYFLGNGTQATPASARVGRVNFRTGSAGSLITGFEVTNYMDIGASSISVSRNNITEAIRVGISDDGTIWNVTVNNAIIKQNLARRLEIIGANSGSISGFSCKNNIFSQGFHLQGNISGEIINNTFDRDIFADEGVQYGNQYYDFQSYISQIQTSGNAVCGKLNIIFKNNIMPNISNYTGDWCPITSYATDIFLFNILNAKGYQYFTYTIPANLGTTNTIVTTTQLNNLYVGYPTNSSGLATDARNQLASNSPAKGVGENGTDAGAFGGDEPYVLSGIPFIPTIYELRVPQTTSQGGTLNVQIKAKTNN